MCVPMTMGEVMVAMTVVLIVIRTVIMMKCLPSRPGRHSLVTVGVTLIPHRLIAARKNHIRLFRASFLPVNCFYEARLSRRSHEREHGARLA